MTQPGHPLIPTALPSHGLPNDTVARIHGVLKRYRQVEKAVLYGSRAKGNYQTGSDIDLTLHGQALSLGLLGSIDSDLDDLLLPYTIDLSIFETLENADLRQHIERVGRVFYRLQAKDIAVGGFQPKNAEI